MKKIITYAPIVFAVCLSIYLLGSFIAWEFNPKQWDHLGRFVAAMIVFVGSGVLIAYNEDKKQSP